MSFNFAQWGLANNDSYASTVAANIRLLQGLSLNGIANALYDIDQTVLDPTVVWDPEVLRQTYEVPLLMAGDDLAKYIAEAAKICGARIPAPVSPMTDPTTGDERQDGRFDPVNAEALTIIATP